MKKFFIPIACAVILSAACSRVAEHDDTPAPSVTTDRVVFPANAPQRKALIVATAEARATEVHHLTGRLVWDEDATVRIYTPVAGRVESVAASLDDRVEKDAPLARLDSPDFGQAQADAHKAEADSVLTERALARTRELFEHGAAPRKDLDAAEDAYAGAQSEQQRAAARLALLGARQAGTIDNLYTLHTPLAGVVVEKNINAGQELRPDLMLANAPQLLAPQFVISDPRRLWVLLDVTETDMGILRPRQPLRIGSRAFPGRTFAGRLDTIGRALDAATRTIYARGSLDNSDLSLKAEMYVDVEIDVPADGGGAVEIANSAVFTKDNRTYVFIETAPGSFLRREVQIGAEADGKILVRSGLQSGERVLVQGSLLIEETLEAGGKS